MTIRPFLAIHKESIGKKNFLLRDISTEVYFEIDDARKITADLIDSFRASKISVGLAAIQIGIAKRIFVINPDKSRSDSEELFINPQVVAVTGDKATSFESCMSMPNIRGPISRRKKIELQYINGNGDMVLRTFTGFSARIIQHEMDHLDGVLCFDHMVNKADIENFEYLNKDNYPVDPKYID